MLVQLGMYKPSCEFVKFEVKPFCFTYLGFTSPIVNKGETYESD